mmetsp:Transcript_45451/g.120547  ORF Transcript_45451/g.120547 Transcript_45451/m.120547 type:complete len:248 (-) Transcript_45451:871-1614(-)
MRMIPHRFVHDDLSRLSLPVVCTFGTRPICHKRKCACDHLVEDHTQTPNIGLLSELHIDHLWRDVQQGATKIFRVCLILLEHLSKTEVDDFDDERTLLDEHDVLWLQVLVQEALTVHEGERPKCLFHHSSHERLGDRFLAICHGLDLILQLTSITRFHDLRDMDVVIEVLKHLNHVGMVQHRHALDLSKDLSHVHVCFSFVDLLANAPVARNPVRDLVHLAETALSDHLAEDVDILDVVRVLSNKHG